ncbi:MAG: hypothetical protein CSA22_10195 [Deltaproteobacteria bacterium]|nr:MAG: hypothetical protein CSA22_10195 [Deltaproteobacteria bacterium]
MNQHLPSKGSKSKTSTLAQKRSLAKMGMIASMGTLVATGFMRSREASAVHVGAGLALVGFSYWHYTLYEPLTHKKKH